MNKGLGEMYAELALKTDKLSDGSKKSESILRKLNADIDNITDAINQKLESIGKTLTIGVTAPLTLLGYQSLKTFTSFEQAMQNTFSVMSATNAEMESLRFTAERMGAETRFSASQAAEALYSLGSAGQNAETAIKSLDGVLKLAGATQSDLGSTSAILASTLSQFKLDASDSSKVADVFAKAISKSQATMNKLAYSMRYVGPIAAGFNMSLEATTGSLMALYNAGYQGEQAGTIMRGGLTRLAQQTKDLDEKLKEIGLTYEDINPAANSFADILDKLKNAGADTARVIGIFGSEAGAGMASLVEQGGEVVRQFDQVLQTSQGAAAEMQKIQNISMANSIAEMKSAWEALQITLTSNVAPAIDNIFNGITGILRVVESLPPGFQVAGTTALVFAAVAGPLLLVAVNVAKLKKEMIALNLVMKANPFLMWGTAAAGAITVVAGLVTQIKKAQEEYEKYAQRMMESAKKIAQQAAGEGEIGRNILNLVNKYEMLDSVVNKSDEQNAAYNATIQELGEIIPGIITQLDDHGNAITINAEKARDAALMYIENEKRMKELALAQLQLGQARALNDLQGYGQAAKDASEEQVRLSRVALEAANRRVDVERKAVEVEKLMNEYIETGNKDLLEQIDEISKSVSSTGNIALARDAAIQDSEKATKALENYQKKYGEIIEKYETSKKTLEDIKNLQEEIALLGTKAAELKEPDDEQKTSWKKYWDDFLKAQEEFNRQNEEQREYAKKTGGSYDAVGAEIDFLDAQLKKLLSIPIDEIDELFSFDDKNTIPIITNRLKELREEQERLKATAKDDTSWGGQLQTLDDYWKQRISMAEQYGEDENALMDEYQSERKKMLEDFIAAAVSSGKYTEESAAEIVLKGYQSISAEIVRTNRITRESIKAFLDEYLKTLGILDSKKNELKSIEVYDPNIFGTMEAWRLYKESLEKEISDIEESLNRLISNETPLEKELRISVENRDIDAAKIAMKKLIDQYEYELSLLEEGTGEWKKKKKQIEDSRKSVQGLKQDIADSLDATATPILNIGNTLADVISTSIVEGGIDGFDALQALSSTFINIGTLIGDPIMSSIAGIAGSIVSITSKIVDAVNSAYAEKKEREAQEMVDYYAEIERKAHEVAGNIASEFAKSYTSGTKKKTLTDYLLEQWDQNKINTIMENMGNYVAYQTDVVDKAGHWEWIWADYFMGGQLKWINTTYNTIDHTIDKIIGYYNQALREGVAEGHTADYWYDLLVNSVDGALAEAGVDTSVKLASYVEGIEDLLTKYVKEGMNLTDFKQALQEKISDAVLSYLMDTMLLGQIDSLISDAFSDVDDTPGKITPEEMGEIFDTATTFANSVKSAYENIMGILSGITTQNKSLTEAITDYKTMYEDMLSGAINTRLQESLRKSYEDLINVEKKLNDAYYIYQQLIKYGQTHENAITLTKVIHGIDIKSLETQRAAILAEMGKTEEAIGKIPEALMVAYEEVWTAAGREMAESVTGSLYASAADADWDGFKNAFTSKLKEAIISAAIGTSTIQEKVNEIIGRVMDDAKVTPEEISGALSELQGYYNEIEEQLAPLTTAIQEMTTEGVETTNSGTIIQQLSGGDRDFFAEQIKAAMAMVQQNLDFTGAAIQTINATQLIINSLTYNHEGNIIIQATEETDLKQFLSDLIGQAMGSA